MVGKMFACYQGEKIKRLTFTTTVQFEQLNITSTYDKCCIQLLNKLSFAKDGQHFAIYVNKKNKLSLKAS